MPVSKRTQAASSVTPYWKSECGRVTIYLGDCREVLPALEPNQFHAVVTDPPYELGFMSKRWDGTGVAYDLRTWEAVLRVVKPGAHLLSFGGSRTYHRMTCAIEDAGWEVRDCIMWVYGSGYPKSMDVSKAIDKKLGVKRSRVRTSMSTTNNINKHFEKLGETRPWKDRARENGYHEHDSDEPVTEEAKEWQGWGTTLKPAYEPCVLARKPLGSTVAECVMENGTGGLNIDACRVGTTGTMVTRQLTPKISSGNSICNFGTGSAGTVARGMEGGVKTSTDGRWPANLIHDGSDEVVKTLPEGAERLFYSPKADDSDRPHGQTAVVHPTVKPLDLMRWMVRLICVRGGRVLDSFMGSGSTGCAAILEGMEFVGIEQSKEYADIAIGKIKLVLGQVPQYTSHTSSESIPPPTKPTTQPTRPPVNHLYDS